MATKRKTQRRPTSRKASLGARKDAMIKDVVEVVAPEVVKKEEEWGEPLDPQEEKVLDWILKGVVIFILGWLGLSILLVIGGYFGIWK